MLRAPVFALLVVALASGLVAEDSPLSHSPSAFVRAHAASPVHWMEWGDAAFARAKAEKKPLYVFVGAFTQELARAMREQSFAREENAALLNEHFVSVVVDREEHPEVAAFFQAYVGSVKQMQGWPLNVWLTPELKPFEGATYLPPSDEWGKEGFPNALRRVQSGWESDPEAQRAKAEEAVAALAAAVPGNPPDSVDAAAVKGLLDEAATAWLASYDKANGGFGDPPRRLEPELLRFLLGREAPADREAALATLRAVVASPVRDPLDGGFFRSAADAEWRQPTLQKTLADQARAAVLCFQAGTTAAGNAALDCALSMRSPDGEYSAAEDGTAEAVVPSFLWTVTDVRTVLGAAEAAPILQRLGIVEAGNLPPDSYLGIDSAGKNLPHADALPTDQAGAAALAKLRAARAQRTAPARDSAASAGTHGLLLVALAQSTEPRMRTAAAGLAEFIAKQLLLPDGQLRAAPGFATAAGPRDYACVADGLLSYAAATGDESARKRAVALLEKADAVYWSAEAGRYFSCPGTPPTGIAVRVIAPIGDGNDLSSAESVMLATLCKHKLAAAARRAALAAAVAADIRDAAANARGDQLLALQAWVAAMP